MTGDNIKRIRKAKNFTQKKLGEMCGIDEANLRKYENGRLEPSLTTIRKIAEALDVALSELIDDWSMFSQGEIWDDLQHNTIDYATSNPREAAKENKLLDNYRQLNNVGQDKAIEQVELLTKIPEYQKEPEE